MAGGIAPIIDLNGNFDVTACRDFANTEKLAEAGLSYAVVSVIGSSRRVESMLLNKLFEIDFTEVDGSCRVSLASVIGPQVRTLVMDVQEQRTEVGAEFDWQDTLFAFAVSDILLICLESNNFVLEMEGISSLLKSVFEVMLQTSDSRNITLLFVPLDGTTRTSLGFLKSVLMEQLRVIWVAVHKPQALQEAPMSQFFNVRLVALHSSLRHPKRFDTQVLNLRTEIDGLINSFSSDRKALVPGSSFPLSLQLVWQTIMGNRYLDLSAHKVTVATFFCNEVIQEKYHYFCGSQEWLQVRGTVASQSIVGSRNNISSLLLTCLSEYDVETSLFDEEVRSSKRAELEGNLMTEVSVDSNLVLEYITSEVFEKFKSNLGSATNGGFGVAALYCINSCLSEFDEKSADAASQPANWNASAIRSELLDSVNGFVGGIRNGKLAVILDKYKGELSEALLGEVVALLKVGNAHTWPSIRKKVQKAIKKALPRCMADLLDLGIDKENIKDKLSTLEEHASVLVDKTAREEAKSILVHMHDRFSNIYMYQRFVPRAWTGRENIHQITKKAYISALQVLAVFAAVRQDDKKDDIERTLFMALIGTKKALICTKEPKATHLLAGNTWKGVSEDRTIYTPFQCMKLWTYLQDGKPKDAQQDRSGGSNSLENFSQTIEAAPAGCEKYIKEAIAARRDHKAEKRGIVFKIRCS